MNESQSTKNDKRHLGIRIFSFCVNKLWLTLATLIIFFALIHIILGLALPRINIYQQEIIDWVKSEYDISIEVSNISAEWNIEGPTLKLSDLNVKSDDGLYNLVELQNVSLNFDLLSSIRDGRFSTDDITIEGADIKFYINRSLGVEFDDSIESSSSLDLEGVSQKLFDVMFGQRKITILNSNLKLYTIAGTEFSYVVDELDVTKFDDIHQLYGKLSYSGGGEVSIVSEVYGDPTTENSYSQVYIDGIDIDIAKLPWLNPQSNLIPSSGALSWKFWGAWEKKRWQSAEAVVELKNTSWSEKNQPDNKLITLLSWQYNDLNHGYMALHNTQLEVSGITQSLPEIHLGFERANELEINWELFFSELELHSLVGYTLSVLDEQDEFFQMLSELELKSSIEKFNLSISKQQEVWELSTVNMMFSNLSFSSWNGLPKVEQLKGVINYSDTGAILKMSASNVDLEYSELFRHVIRADSLSAEVEWLKGESGIGQFNINTMSFKNKDVEVQSRGSFFIEKELPIFSLYTELTNVNIANKSLYLPVGVMTTDLVSYLDGGVKSGSLSLVKGIVRGPLNQFPFANLDGVFIAHGKAENAVFEYLPNWPIADNLTASLLFEGTSMDIVASSGESLNNKVESARAFVENLADENPMLQLTLNVNSIDNSGKNFLKLTPLRSLFEAIEVIEYQGKLDTKVKLDIGLNKPEEIKVIGHIAFDPTKALVVTPVISMSQINGVLNFDEKGITKSELSAQYLEQIIDLTLQGARNKEEAVLSIDAKGILPAAGISHFIGEPWLQFFDGQSEFSSLIQFSPSEKPTVTRVFFQTDFKGMEISFPGSTGKLRDEITETYLTLDIDETSTGEISWANISGNWYWKMAENITEEKQSSLETNLDYGGDFYINQSKPELKDIRPGLRVSGRFNDEKLTDWLEFVTNVEKGDQYKTDDSFELVFNSIDLQLAKLDIEIASIEKLDLNLKKHNDQPWDITFKSDQANGNIKVNEFSPWQIKLASLNLSLKNELQSSKPQLGNRISPLDLKSMDIDCLSCTVNEVNYGELLVELRESLNGVSMIGKVKNQLEHELSISGFWIETEDSLSETSISFDLASNNVGKLLDNWDVDATIEDSPGQIYSNLWWQGAPWELDYTSLDGDLQVSLGKGYLSEISDEQGRIFSLFNLQSIIRKLTFDFKDVYKKGFFYDSIAGTIQIRDGLVSTENVEIEGNVADVKLFGETDLKRREINQTAVITPHLTSSFPVLAAWAVEPTTGLIVFLLDKIMEPAVEVATQLDYQITGTFDDVLVEEIKRSKKKVIVEYTSETKVPDLENIDLKANDVQKDAEPNDDNTVIEPKIEKSKKLQTRYLD